MRKLLLALTLLASPASGQTTLINPPTGHDAWIIPSAGGTVLYGPTDSTDNYAISQWNNPVSDLGNFAAISCAGSFASFTNCIQATSPNIVVTSYIGTDGNQWKDFNSTGVGVNCGTELDSYHTSISKIYKNYPQAVVENVNLLLISHLYAAFKAEPIAFSTIDTICATFQDSLVIGFTFVDTVASPSQTLFYDLILYKWPSPATAGWFANSTPFGYRDVMASYGQSPLTVGVVTDFTGASKLDILPLVKAVITGATNGLDTNIANWETRVSFQGHNAYGDTTAESAFCCFTLSATLAPVGMLSLKTP